MILYRFLSLYFVQILTIAFCYAQRVETDHLTVKGYSDLDELEDNMVVARKTIFDKDEEGHDYWHASAVYVHGKIRLGNKEMLSFTDYDDLDESQSGGLTYVSPQQGIIIRDLWTQSGCSVMEVYDYYMFDATSHDWYKYKTATYGTTAWLWQSPKSRLLRKIEAGDRNIYREYVSFCRYKGKVLKELVKRRQVEFVLFYIP